jgi:hypothetical protein
MKFRRISFLLALLALAALTACASISTEINVKEGFGATYPSQFLTGDVYVLKNHEKIDGNISGIGTTLIIEDGAMVMGDISLVASNLEVNGRVAGDINLFAGTSTINDTAIVTGSINQIFNQTSTTPQALVNGDINTYVFPTSGDDNISKGLLNALSWIKPSHWFSLQVGRVMVLVIISVMAAFLFNQPNRRVIRALHKNPVTAWGVGIITQFFVPIIALVLIVTICLSPVGIIAIFVLAISILWGWAALSLIVGERLEIWLKFDWSDVATSAIGAILTGVIISAISLIPCLGFLFNVLLSAVGLGGVILSRFGTYEE